MGLDLFEVHRVAKARGLEEVTRVGPEDRHFAELAAVALEVAVVNGIKTNKCGEEPDIGFRNAAPP